MRGAGLGGARAAWATCDQPSTTFVVAAVMNLTVACGSTLSLGAAACGTGLGPPIWSPSSLSRTLKIGNSIRVIVADAAGRTDPTVAGLTGLGGEATNAARDFSFCADSSRSLKVFETKSNAPNRPMTANVERNMIFQNSVRGDRD